MTTVIRFFVLPACSWSRHFPLLSLQKNDKVQLIVLHHEHGCSCLRRCSQWTPSNGRCKRNAKIEFTASILALLFLRQLRQKVRKGLCVALVENYRIKPCSSVLVLIVFSLQSQRLRRRRNVRQLQPAADPELGIEERKDRGGAWWNIFFQILSKNNAFLCKISTIFEMHPVNGGGVPRPTPLNPPLAAAGFS